MVIRQRKAERGKDLRDQSSERSEKKPYYGLKKNES